MGSLYLITIAGVLISIISREINLFRNPNLNNKGNTRWDTAAKNCLHRKQC